ncbi:MAG: hypothetical protein U1E27_07890, partial [Kiritimatiellia bacterium]|nr:hypothetical protein [Kiritimatiellia bacterium]
ADASARGLLRIAEGGSLTNTLELQVGREGFGRVDVLGGGTLLSGHLDIAALAGGQGGVWVSGAGSTLAAAISGGRNITVGGANGVPGGAGALTVEAGGLVTASGGLLALGGSVVEVDGGRIEAASATFSNAVFRVTLTSPDDPPPLQASGQIRIHSASPTTLQVKLSDAFEFVPNAMYRLAGYGSLHGVDYLFTDPEGYPLDEGDTFAVEGRTFRINYGLEPHRITLTALVDPVLITLPYGEDFENPAPGAGPMILGWGAGPDDQSEIVSLAYPYNGPRPMPESGATQVLRLDTGDSRVWMNVAMENGEVPDAYLDLLVSFAAMTSPPGGLEDGQIKLALYMNEDGRLVVFHGGADGETGTRTEFPAVYEPGRWYRITIPLNLDGIDDGAGGRIPFFRIQMDGVSLAATGTGFAEPSADPLDATGGAWFRFANHAAQSGSAEHRKIRRVAFRGTGWLDEVTLKTAMHYRVRTVLGAQGAMTPAGIWTDIPFAAYEMIVSDGDPASIVFTADPFFVLDRMVSDGVTVPAASGVESFEWSRSAVTGNVSNYVVFAEAPLWPEDGKSPLWWAQARGFRTDGAIGMYASYLLNQTDLDIPCEIVEFGVTATGHPFVKWIQTGAPRGVLGVEANANLQHPGGWLPLAGHAVVENGIATWTAQ